MSRVLVKGEPRGCTHDQLCEIDELAAKLKVSREQAAEKYFEPKAKKPPPAKKAEEKKEAS